MCIIKVILSMICFLAVIFIGIIAIVTNPYRDDLSETPRHYKSNFIKSKYKRTIPMKPIIRIQGYRLGDIEELGGDPDEDLGGDPDEELGGKLGGDPDEELGGKLDGYLGGKQHNKKHSTKKNKKTNISSMIIRKSAGNDDYTNIDEAVYKYSIGRTKDIFGSNNIQQYVGNKDPETLKKKDLETHSWYKYKSWDDLFTNKSMRDQYFNDLNYARSEMLFEWDKVFDKVIPLLQEKVETIGVLRTESDKKTLYIYAMERSPDIGSTKSYAAGVPVHLVRKYADMPGYFLFHTHPVGGDPLPSDADIYNSLLDCYTGHFMGHVVIGTYGAVIYFLRSSQLNRLKEGTKSILKYLTYCYDLINAWNAICNSSGPMNEKDRVSFLEFWHYDMVVIPFPKYISYTHNKTFVPKVLTNDRFIYTKYKLSDEIKRTIKNIETDEERN